MRKSEESELARTERDQDFEAVGGRARRGARRCDLLGPRADRLRVRVYGTGRKAYVVQVRGPTGGMRRATLGIHGDVAPDEARKDAAAIIDRIQRGEEPFPTPPAPEPTVADLAARCMTAHVEVNCRPNTVATFRRMVERYIVPELGRLELSAVERSHVTDLHFKMRDKPAQANHTVKVLSKMFRLAEAWGMTPSRRNPCRSVRLGEGNRWERFLTPEEYRKLGRVLDEAETKGRLLLHYYRGAWRPLPTAYEGGMVFGWTSDFSGFVLGYDVTRGGGRGGGGGGAAPDLQPDFGTAAVPDQEWMESTQIAPLALPAASGGDAPLAYWLTPNPPQGILLDAAARLMTGTPAGAQEATEYTWTVRDADGDEDSLTFSIAVAADPRREVVRQAVRRTLGERGKRTRERRKSLAARRSAKAMLARAVKEGLIDPEAREWLDKKEILGRNVPACTALEDLRDLHARIQLLADELKTLLRPVGSPVPGTKGTAAEHSERPERKRGITVERSPWGDRNVVHIDTANQESTDESVTGTPDCGQSTAWGGETDAPCGAESFAETIDGRKKGQAALGAGTKAMEAEYGEGMGQAGPGGNGPRRGCGATDGPGSPPGLPEKGGSWKPDTGTRHISLVDALETAGPRFRNSMPRPGRPAWGEIEDTAGALVPATRHWPAGVVGGRDRHGQEIRRNLRHADRPEDVPRGGRPGALSRRLPARHDRPRPRRQAPPARQRVRMVAESGGLTRVSGGLGRSPERKMENGGAMDGSYRFPPVPPGGAAVSGHAADARRHSAGQPSGRSWMPMVEPVFLPAAGVSVIFPTTRCRASRKYAARSCSSKSASIRPSPCESTLRTALSETGGAGTLLMATFAAASLFSSSRIRSNTRSVTSLFSISIISCPMAAFISAASLFSLACRSRSSETRASAPAKRPRWRDRDLRNFGNRAAAIAGARRRRRSAGGRPRWPRRRSSRRTPARSRAAGCGDTPPSAGAFSRSRPASRAARAGRAGAP